MEQQPLLILARHTALAAHTGQVRKYTGEPYFTHCEEVAALVKEVGGSADMVAAAYLHDVVEDTDWTLHEMEMIFGPIVARYVAYLTNAELVFGNSAERKALDIARLALAPPEVQTIKLADLISNTRTIEKYDPKFAKVYMREKNDLLVVLTKGDATLLRRARAIVSDYYSRQFAAAMPD
jgi:(p)ppGpp synthase/HD superfamily hydrolase